MQREYTLHNKQQQRRRNLFKQLSCLDHVLLSLILFIVSPTPIFVSRPMVLINMHMSKHDSKAVTSPQFNSSCHYIFLIKWQTGSPAHFQLNTTGSVAHECHYRGVLTCADLADDHQQVNGGPLWVWTAAVSTHFIPGTRPQALRHLVVGQGIADHLVQVIQPRG